MSRQQSNRPRPAKLARIRANRQERHRRAEEKLKQLNATLAHRVAERTRKLYRVECRFECPAPC